VNFNSPVPVDARVSWLTRTCGQPGHWLGRVTGLGRLGQTQTKKRRERN